MAIPVLLLTPAAVHCRMYCVPDCSMFFLGISYLMDFWFFFALYYEPSLPTRLGGLLGSSSRHGTMKCLGWMIDDETGLWRESTLSEVVK